jgi:hypothetical protein
MVTEISEMMSNEVLQLLAFAKEVAKISMKEEKKNLSPRAIALFNQLQADSQWIPIEQTTIKAVMDAMQASHESQRKMAKEEAVKTLVKKALIKEETIAELRELAVIGINC